MKKTIFTPQPFSFQQVLTALEFRLPHDDRPSQDGERPHPRGPGHPAYLWTGIRMGIEKGRVNERAGCTFSDTKHILQIILHKVNLKRSTCIMQLCETQKISKDQGTPRSNFC